MGRRVNPRTFVEEAPSHDGRPYCAAWEMTETDPDTQTPPDASNRPKEASSLEKDEKDDNDGVFLVVLFGLKPEAAAEGL
ncbi:hypothetical protein EsH8_XI_000131 [Colletotrichum jinshuiense]